MNPNPDPLEKRIHESLRELPLRRAPRSLEARVMAEIARREALPWWHRSWTYWPAAVRWTFLVFSAAVAAVIVFGGLSLLQGATAQTVHSGLARPLGWLTPLAAAVMSLGRVTRDLFDLIPNVWLYAALASIAALYATVVGLGATAYRLLWQSR